MQTTLAERKAIQPGDKVIIEHGYGNMSLGTVERLTKTQIVLDKYSRYRIQTGRRVGDADSWHPSRLHVLNERNKKIFYEMLAKVQRKRNVRFVQEKLSSVPDDVLNQILELVKEYTETEK